MMTDEASLRAQAQALLERADAAKRTAEQRAALLLAAAEADDAQKAKASADAAVKAANNAANEKRIAYRDMLKAEALALIAANEWKPAAVDHEGNVVVHAAKPWSTTVAGVDLSGTTVGPAVTLTQAYGTPRLVVSYVNAKAVEWLRDNGIDVTALQMWAPRSHRWNDDLDPHETLCTLSSQAAGAWRQSHERDAVRAVARGEEMPPHWSEMPERKSFAELLAAWDASGHRGMANEARLALGLEAVAEQMDAEEDSDGE